MKENHPVIIVDNNQSDRVLIQEVFKDIGCNKEIIQFENGFEFITFLSGIPRNEYPSMVLLDLNIPQMDGMQLLRELKSNTRFRHIPVVVYTSRNIIHNRTHAFQQGANCFITKPEDPGEVTDLMESIAMLWCLYN